MDSIAAETNPTKTSDAKESGPVSAADARDTASIRLLNEVHSDAQKAEEPGFLNKIAENTWLQINGASYHFDRSKHFNEQNYGLGLMYKIAPDKAVAIGQYENSIRHTSHYAYFDYEPLKVGPVRAGILAGVVDGYYFNHGGPIPMVLPTVSVEGKHFGVSAFYIPPMPQISSVVALQARIKF